MKHDQYYAYDRAVSNHWRQSVPSARLACLLVCILFARGKIGQLLFAFGVCTIVAEGLLVRCMVPVLGEKLTLQIGRREAVSFAARSVVRPSLST